MCSSEVVDGCQNSELQESKFHQPISVCCLHLAEYFGYFHLDYESDFDSIHYYYAFVSNCSSGWLAIVVPPVPWPVELDFVVEAEQRSVLAMNWYLDWHSLVEACNFEFAVEIVLVVLATHVGMMSCHCLLEILGVMLFDFAKAGNVVEFDSAKPRELRY